MKQITIVISMLLSWQLLFSQENNSLEVITSGDLEAWVSYLASDDMLGRRNGSPEMREAAFWLADLFGEFGIQEFGEYPGFIQDYSFSMREDTIDERNVIGYIEGSDPELKDEYIIITAHFDHVGVGEAVEGDSIYNGADDNAAGTATLLGVAKYLRLTDKLPGRSLIFAAFSGEEMGMRGSRHLANNPPVALAAVYANINFEMMGHSEDLGKESYMLTGSTFTNLDELVKEFEKDSRISLSDSAISERYFYMSDNISFSRIKQEEDIIFGIPSGTFGSSTIATHIHTPWDEIELFDLENMAGLVNHFSEMILWLSRCKEPVIWTSPNFRQISESKS